MDTTSHSTTADHHLPDGLEYTLTKGQTAQTLKGFKSKEGKTVDAKLRLDAEYQVRFVFENRK